jgi:hypothetical protein
MEVEDMLQFGAQTVAALVSDAEFQKMGSWLALLDQCLAAAGALDGTEAASGNTPQRQYSTQP